jgi:hypothetical protein
LRTNAIRHADSGERSDGMKKTRASEATGRKDSGERSDGSKDSGPVTVGGLKVNPPRRASLFWRGNR